jgi:hypothetical protein
MQKKRNGHSGSKRDRRKPAQGEPVPPAEKDMGHGEEVAPAKEGPDAPNSPKEVRTNDAKKSNAKARDSE